MPFLGRVREIVLSVNTTDDGALRTLAEKHPETRVVSPGAALGHAAHWEYAIGQAGGEWVALLTDRAVLRHDWLATLESHAAATPLLTFRTMAVMREEPDRFVVQLPWFSGETSMHSASPWREGGSRMQFAEHGPYLLNTLVHRSVLQKVRERAGSICGDLVGDCGFYARCLSAGIDWLHIEQPLVIMHSAETGIGASLVTGTRTPALESFLRDLAAAGGFRHVPLPEIATNMNVRANEFAAAFPTHPLDAQAYASALAAELAGQHETFPTNAWEQVTAFVREREVTLEPPRSRRRVRHLARRAARRALGTGTSPLHRRLNLPVRCLGSLESALDWARCGTCLPNRTAASNGSWQ